MTKIVFQRFSNSIFCWKKSFVKFIEKKISDFSNEENITSCLKNEYASEYKRVLMRFKSITILGLLFFQITNADEAAENIVPNDTFWTRPFLANGFKMSFIAFLFFADMKYEICLKSSTSISFLNEIDILISSLNFFNPDLKNLTCLINISKIFVLNSNSQWSFTSGSVILFFSDAIANELMKSLIFFSEARITFSNNTFVYSKSNVTVVNCLKYEIKRFNSCFLWIFAGASPKFVTGNEFHVLKIIALIADKYEFVMKFLRIDSKK